jgi:fibronectin-binding autotransporter adhesin
VQNQNKNTDTIYGGNGTPLAGPAGFALANDDSSEALSLDPGALARPEPLPPVSGSASKAKLLVRLFKRADIILLLLLVGGLIGLFITTSSRKANNASQVDIADQYETVQLPLEGFVQTDEGVSFGAGSVLINGSLQLNNDVVITPSQQPTAPKVGQIYYDQTSNQMAYYNGAQFVPMVQQGTVVQTIGGVSGALTLGNGLGVVGSQLVTTTTPGIPSFGGQAGAITVGNGLQMTGATLSNGGVVSLTPGTANLVVGSDGNGNLTISSVGGGTGTVTSGGGTAGRIAKFTGVQNVEDSLLSESGSTVTTSGNLTVTGTLSLGNALSVANGGTGRTTLTLNGVLVGQGAGALASVTGTSGQCLTVDGSGVPVFGSCGGGISSLNGLTGALTIANASGAGTTITLNDATTAAKGIASFNNTNFSVSSGAVNTIQDIHSGATPTFAGLNTNTITPSAALTVGISAQTALLQGSTTTITSSGAGNDIVLNAADTIELQDNTNITGAATVSGDLAVNGGDLTASGALNITPGGALTVGASGQNLTLQGNASTSLRATASGNTTIVAFTSPTANTTLNFPALTAGTYTICTSSGNCSGAGVTLQAAYDNSTSPEFVLDATRGAITIRDNATPIGANLLEVQNNGGGTTYLAVTSSGLAVTGTATVSGNINSSGGTLQTGGTTRIDNSGNATNIGNVTLSGAISGGTSFSGSGTINTTGGVIQTNSTTRIDNSGNLTNIANITSTGSTSLQGGTVTLGTNAQAGSLVVSDGSSNTGTLQVAALGQNTVYTLPDPGGASDQICLLGLANCVGTGGGVTGSGTQNRLAKFTSTGNTIGDSTITDTGTAVTTTVDAVIQGGDLTVGTTAQGGSLILHDGDGQTTTFQAGNSSGNLTFIFPTSAGSADQCLKQSGTGNQLVWQDCDGGGGGSSATLQSAYNNGNIITTTEARDIDIVLADTTNDANFDIQVATGSTGFVSIARADGAGTADPAQLLLLDNLDANRTQPIGLKLQATFGMTTALDATDTEIGTALSVAANDILGTTGNIDFTNFDVLGASGNTTIGGTLGVTGNTTLTGDLAVNGSDITSSGALNLNATGTIELQDATNITGNLDVSGTLAVGTADAFQVSAAGVVTLIGGIARDITTANAGTANPITLQPGQSSADGGTAATLFLKGSDQTSGNCGGCSGGKVVIQGGAQIGGGGFRFGGGVEIDGGTGANQNGAISIGSNVSGDMFIGTAAQARSISIGTAAAAQTVTLGSTNSTSSTTIQSGSGGIALIGNTTATGAFTASGGTIQFNSNANNTTAINNGTSTGSILIGGGGAPLTIDSTAFDVTAGGAVSGVTTLSTSGIITQGALGTADNTTFLCRNSSNQIAACSTTGAGASFVQGGNSFGTAATLGTNDNFSLTFEVNGNAVVTLADTTGTANFRNISNNTQALNVENANGDNLFTVDTTNSRVGINMGASNTPTLESGTAGMELQGALRVSGQGISGWDIFTTPNNVGVRAKVNIVVQNEMPAGGQVMALGVTDDAGVHDNARVLSLFDDRSSAHQPTLLVFDPNENSGVGFNWNGSTTTANVQTLDTSNGNNTTEIVLRSGNTTGGGTSGAVFLQSGSIAGGTGGSTGSVAIQSGNGGGTNSSSGNVGIDVGSVTGSGTAGAINVGTIRASAITIGRSGLTTSNPGALTVGQLITATTLGTADTATFLCRNSSNQIATCSGGGTTLQSAYDAGNTILATNNRNLDIDLADTATDPNFLIDLQCDTSCSTNGRFAIQDDGVDVFSISPAGGAVLIQPTTDSVNALNVRTSTGNNIFTIDTNTSRIGIGLGGTTLPTLDQEGIELKGALRLNTTGNPSDLYTSPNGANVSAMINIQNLDPGGGGQLIAMGLPLGADSTARGVSVFDKRAGAHQPSLAVFSPGESQIGGFSWDGSDTAFLVKNTASGSIGLNVAGTTRLSATTSGADVTGLLTASAGLTASGAAVQLNVSSNNNTSINTGTSTGAVSIGNSAAGAITIQSGSSGVSLLSGGNITIGTADTTGTLLVLDTKTNSGDPTGVDGAMYYNSNMGMMRCYYDSAWRFCNEPMSLSWGYTVEEEFLGQGSANSPSSYEWFKGLSGTGASISPVSPSDPKRIGILRFATGTEANGNSHATNFMAEDGFGQDPVLLGGGENIEMAINLDALSTAGTEYDLRVGLCDKEDGDCVDGVYFEYDRNTSTDWSLVTANNSTRTRVQNSNAGCTAGSGSSVAVAAGSWVRFKMALNSDASRVSYYINGTFVGCITTNIPTSRNTGPYFSIQKDGSHTTSNIMDVDYFHMRNSLTTPR